jgi:uncharacterized membrane protein YcaP (DUF421 family)
MDEVKVIAFRSVIAFVGLLIFARLLGKTQISQFTFFDYITGITIGSIASRLATSPSVRAWPTYLGMIIWTILALSTQFLSLRSRLLGNLLDGEPALVIQNGKVLERNLGKLRVRIDDLISMLRAQGVFDLATIEFAVMEPHGDLSVLKRSQDRPVTPKDLQLATSYEGLGVEVILEGKVLVDNLRRLHLNQAWLREKLGTQGVADHNQVLLAIVDTKGGLYVDLYDDGAGTGS